ncbi:YtxH domain-containing protein [Criibacterium bergeronii]|uniref:YtxH domain-containing protein n=1 Tax=Criibacterium bergeronii TaxID=1871336 RepID=A0A371IKK2_9FIRM|nr:YtxH domain-containing protein [Criibacterium bergeronii]MBS6063007.1 YtxH domain-containing protein [Peptostreptococcaceae bacterium]RDY21022.1 YtxH domain-containing protein [Criibacterium bergeronii]TRW25529.1 YtxH domain-containing protein [Criibacterium bergeronii]
MRKNDDMNLFAVLGATVIGTVIGVAVGLLVAPKAGEEFRGDIASGTKDLVKKAKSKRDSFLEDFDDHVEEVGDLVSDITK